VERGCCGAVKSISNKNKDLRQPNREFHVRRCGCAHFAANARVVASYRSQSQFLLAAPRMPLPGSPLAQGLPKQGFRQYGLGSLGGGLGMQRSPKKARHEPNMNRISEQKLPQPICV